MGKHKQKPKTLSSGRPPMVKKPKSISRKDTRALINSHHTLQKKLQQAIARGDSLEETALNTELSSLGGLAEYQQASLQGQRNDRGGDSSKILLEWLRPAHGHLRKLGDRKVRMLEVGALSTDNACSTSGLFDMELIDLRSQQPGILQQDFMERPLPDDDMSRFDVISLSLVLNYVPEPSLRGKMLHRSLSFLRNPEFNTALLDDYFPSLFIVLPRSCIFNSRYFSEQRFEELMSLLGYSKARSRHTQKLAYFLWKRRATIQEPLPAFHKKEVNPGGGRNNFAIVLKAT